MNPLLTVTGLAVVLLASSPLHANVNNANRKDANLQVGINALYSDKGFKDYDSSVAVMPSFFYDNGTVYARGNRLGYNFIKDQNNELSVFAQYAGSSYDPDNAEGAFKSLNERESTLMAGVSYLYRSKLGGIRGQVATDVLGESKGTVARLTYLSKYQNNKLTLYPSIGLQWQDDSYNDYYYGISAQEANKTGIQRYTADSSIHPYISVTGFYDLTDDWSLFMNQNVSYNADEVYNSPMVESRTSTATTLGVLYQF